MKGFFIILTLLVLLNPPIYAEVEVKQFSTPQEELRYKSLNEELRCLVCQNQNLAGSNSGLAHDLRKQVYTMIRAGKSDDEIKDFMVTRYGDFVLYRPPFKTTTFLLWVGPFIILALGLLVLIRFIRQRKLNVVTTLTDNDKEKVSHLLEDDKEQDQ